MQKKVEISRVTGKHVLCFDNKSVLRYIDDYEKSNSCSFCKGKEVENMKEIYAYPKNDWNIKVVPSPFNVLSTDIELEKKARSKRIISWTCDEETARGAHEIIIETPEHEKEFYELDTRRVIDAYIARMKELLRDEKIKHIAIFKDRNIFSKRKGLESTVMHPFSQLLGTAFIPKKIVAEITGAQNFFGLKFRCGYCDDIKERVEEGGDLLITENESFFAYCPVASSYAYEVCIIPKRHNAIFHNIDEKEKEDFSSILSRVYKAESKISKNISFGIHSLFREEGAEDFYHWHLVMKPISYVIGFELSGISINPVFPEDAAKELREKIE